MINGPHTVEARLAALERQNRRFRAIIGVLVVLVATPFVLGAQQSTQDTIRARRLEIVQANGKNLVTLGSYKEGGEILVYNTAGNRVGYFTAEADGGSLDISDQNGKTVGYFDAKTGGATLAVKRDEKEFASVSSVPSSGGQVQVNDKDGRRAAYLLGRPNGGSLDISKYGETVGYFDAVNTYASGGDSNAVLCVGKNGDGCLAKLPR